MSEAIETSLNKSWVKALVFVLGTSLNIAFSLYKDVTAKMPNDEQFKNEIRGQISAIREDLAALKGEIRGSRETAANQRFH